MKILIAGATGAIGRPLIHFLSQFQHEIYGITQSTIKANELKDKGVSPLILDILNQSAVLKVVNQIKPEIIIDMLTHLPKEYTPKAMQEAFEMDTKIRLVGGSNLQMAAEACSTKRFIAQSTGFWYEPGKGLADESTLLAFDGPPGIAAGVRVYDEIERRVLNSSLEGVIMRFGFFYGPGTWYNPTGNVADQLREKQIPLIGKGQGIWNFVHIQDAAQAVVSAIHAAPGIYNIVNDHPAQLSEWLPAFAQYIQAPMPPLMTEQEGLQRRGEDSVYYATRLRGASNTKAKRDLDFQPRSFEWLD